MLDGVARTIDPARPAIICDDAIMNWAALDAAANSLARALTAAGLKPGAKIAHYMRNGPAYLVTLAAALKGRFAHVNVNFRYGGEELIYLLDNADAEACVYDAAFANTVAAIKTKLPHVRAWIEVGGESGDYEAAISGDGAPLNIDRSSDDLLLLYTGGTTGLPKGVMWTQAALWGALAAGRATQFGAIPPMTREDMQAQIARGEGLDPVYVAPPLMHGTALFSAINVLSKGGAVVVTTHQRFDPEAAIAAVDRYRCVGFIIVGDAFARPLLDTLRATRGRYDVTCLRTMTSSGMMWSPEVKTGLLDFMPDALLVDSFGASEGTGLGMSITARDMPAQEAKFLAPNTIVVRMDDHTPIAAGSDEIGIVAKAGDLPLGYYKDEARTARVYVTIEGVRRVLTGDHAQVLADGGIKLLGRGSHCINSGGEKIYPEEVEEALKTHADVHDALVFGVADERFGQSVAAVVARVSDAHTDEAALIAHVRATLAHYKAPRRIVFTDTAPRAVNGKPDYARAKEIFAAG
jgi:fatty-acyl-CoA synthase